ncbi:hypothetical protein M0813_22415 [Anaeramoeba flamelloides]|uniref:Uncharacterized protein n=1 Tax=Anaeramoeba flamelloides TaxID=1746091 RepID=A0ABQ8YF99_9EUKA|nr:hypothetical protein M0813_22415 [Anaeramoeba flamelloides]
MTNLRSFGSSLKGVSGLPQTGKLHYPSTPPLFGRKIISDFQIGDTGSLFILEGGTLYQQNESKTNTTPKKVDIESVKKIAVGVTHFLALGHSGILYSWGTRGEKCNHAGQLGLGHLKVIQNPTPISKFETLLKKGKEYAIKDIQAGFFTSFVLLQNGDLYAFGNNQGFALGFNDLKYTNEPLLLAGDVKQIFSSAYTTHTFVLTNQDKLFAFGSNRFGELSVGKLSCSVSEDGLFTPLDNTLGQLPITPAIFSGDNAKIKKISSSFFGSLLLDTDHRLWSCGSPEQSGQLIAESVFKRMPIINQKIINICSGAHYNVAIAFDGTIYAMGLPKNIAWANQKNTTYKNKIFIFPVKGWEADIHPIIQKGGLEVTCGYDFGVTLLAKMPRIYLDFERLWNTTNQDGNFAIGSRKIHKEILQFRINSNIDDVKSVLEKKTNQKFIDDFLYWVYTGLRRSHIIDDFAQLLGINNCQEKYLINDLKSLFANEKTKNVKIELSNNNFVLAHRIILKLRGDGFEEKINKLLQKEENENENENENEKKVELNNKEFITINDELGKSLKVWNLFLKFIYLGSIEIEVVTLKNIKDVIELSKYWKIHNDNFLQDFLNEFLQISKCSFCQKKVGMLKCSRCKRAFYCSRDCQKNDWSKHKKVCKVYVKK